MLSALTVYLSLLVWVFADLCGLLLALGGLDNGL